MVILLSLLIAIIGVLMYALAANPKLQEIGRILFFCGMLAFLIEWPAWIGATPHETIKIP